MEFMHNVGKGISSVCSAGEGREGVAEGRVMGCGYCR
jgi:hypothetical protein